MAFDLLVTSRLFWHRNRQAQLQGRPPLEVFHLLLEKSQGSTNAQTEWSSADRRSLVPSDLEDLNSLAAKHPELLADRNLFDKIQVGLGEMRDEAERRWPAHMKTLERLLTVKGEREARHDIADLKRAYPDRHTDIDNKVRQVLRSISNP
jgi:hypothetical protein